ncbi:MAG TPA: PAS domain S-box protein [Terriglobales bacterium]|nr:PAS domain S-box protein [Terriglobales bacterium]
MSTTEIPASSSSASAYPPSTASAHVVQFYGADEALMENLLRLVGTALVEGDAAVVIATQAHLKELAANLSSRCLDLTQALQQGSYVPLDASQTLAEFVVDGRPDRARFLDYMGGIIAQAARSSGKEHPRVVVFGEMVALLWADGDSEAAIQLEQLWNDLAKGQPFVLHCAYPLADFYRSEHSEALQKISAEHTAVLPHESYTALTDEGARLRTVALLQQKAQALEHELVLRQFEARFRLFVEAVQDYAIFMLDADGRVASWNAGAQRLKGYQAEEIIGKHFSVFYPEEDLKWGKPDWELKVAAKEGRFEDEGWRVRKDGSRFWANVIITALKDSAGNLIGFGKVTRDFTERMQTQVALQRAKEELERQVAERQSAEQKLRDSEASLRRLSLHLLRTQDEERRRIGRELHDTLGQYLAALKITLDSFSASASDQQLTDTIAECLHLTGEAIREMRTLSYLMYPPMLEEMGLNSAIGWYLEGFTERSQIQTTLEAPADFRRLAPDVELTLFRVLQEALTNVHRHSGSSTAHVRLFVENGTVGLEIKDHGKGIPRDMLQAASPDCPTSRGVGLRGMKERLQDLGGSLQVLTNGGTTIRALVPVK